jgi:hypothetical protein
MILTFVFIMLLFFDIFFTQFLLKKIRQKDKEWYEKEKGPIAHLVYKSFGLNKGFILMLIIGSIISIFFLYFTVLVGLETEFILNPQIFYTMSLVFLITLYTIIIALNANLFKTLKNK